jgi:hypothetical protein
VTDQVEIPDTDDVTAAAFLTVELPELLAIAGTVHAGMLEALAAVLARRTRL